MKQNNSHQIHPENVEKWSDSGKWHKWHQHNRKRNDNVYPAKLYKGNFTEGIWCTVSFVRKYISRYFKEHFHITLSQYVNHLRLEHARQLLEESAASVTEVAMCSGYQNVSYFIRSFKKMYGVSPLKYRNFQTLP